MPIIIMIIIINYELLYLQSLYEQSILSMFHRPSFRAVAVFTLYQLLFKISKGKKKKQLQDFYKNVCFCTRTRGFVVLCITVALLLWIKHVADIRKPTTETPSDKRRPQKLCCAWGIVPHVKSADPPFYLCIRVVGPTARTCRGSTWLKTSVPYRLGSVVVDRWQHFNCENPPKSSASR